MDEKTIKKTLLKGERVTLECKKAKVEVPKSIWQTYSAFANTIGGLILLGVDEDLQEKHDDRLCFRNPGLLKLPVETIYRGGNSKARNPKIQNMLRMIGFGENVGFGFPKIIAAWKETNWGEPVLLNKVELDEVELVLPVTSPKTAPESATVNATVNATVKLNKTQTRILPILQSNKFATYEEIAKQLDIERTTVWRNLDSLKKKNVIKRVGGDKDGHWEVLICIEDCNK